MTAQEDSGSPQVDSIVEVHDDADAGDDRFVGTETAGIAAVVLFALSIGGALLAGKPALAAGLAVLTLLFAAALAAGAMAER